MQILHMAHARCTIMLHGKDFAAVWQDNKAVHTWARLSMCHINHVSCLHGASAATKPSNLSHVCVPAAGFLTYAATALAVVVLLIWGAPPEWGTTNIFVYVGICSLMGSLSVVSCKVRCSNCGCVCICHVLNQNIDERMAI